MEFAHVSKRFRLGTRADSLRDLLPALGRAVGRAFAPAQRRGRDSADDFWALRDVSFTVEPGEVLGIIGANGAGKSTVLRLLTGLLRPDAGSVQVRGRIGALIELAAGFHPDLTGRENVFLQGAILGLTRAEVRQRFDAIVDFAEVAEFLDTPVKHYSSGMNARLGFAIAVHAEPDVLLVDEILSVGDRAFQAKAFDRLAAEVRRGIPVVVVSHQLDRIGSLCQRAILLSHGTVAFAGPAPECVAAYLSQGARHAALETGPCPVVLTSLTLDGAPVCAPGARATLRLGGEVHAAGSHGDGATDRSLDELTLGVRIWSLPTEQRVGAMHRTARALGLPSSGAFTLDLGFSANLGPGLYRLQAAAWHTSSLREWAVGPAVAIEVTRDERASGSVWLAPDFGTPG